MGATAIQSYSFSTNLKPEIVGSLFDLAPISQIQTGGRILFPPSKQSHKGMDNRPTVILYPPTESHQSIQTGTRNTNDHAVIKRSVEVNNCWQE